MYSNAPTPPVCPVCGEPMTISRLRCEQCDVTVEGRFSMGRLARLTPEQLGFVELFLRCDGKLKRVGQEMGVSYPTVRSRLDEIITAMGYEPSGHEEPNEDTLSPERRRQILDELAAGNITSEEAVRLLQGE